MFAVLHSDINSQKSGLLHLTSQPYCKESRSAKVKDGIINLFLRNYLVGRARDKYSSLLQKFVTYGRKKLYNIGPGSNPMKLFFSLLMLRIS
jgi:hypothetical protein